MMAGHIGRHHGGPYRAPPGGRPYEFRRTGDLHGRPFKCGDIGRALSGAHDGAPLPFIHHFIHAHHLLHHLVHSFGGTI